MGVEYWFCIAKILCGPKLFLILHENKFGKNHFHTFLHGQKANIYENYGLLDGFLNFCAMRHHCFLLYITKFISII